MTSPSFLLLGAGGHARVCFDALLKIEPAESLVGVVSPELKIGAVWQGPNVVCLGDDKAGQQFVEQNTSVLLINGCGYMPRSRLRYKLYNEYKKKGASFYRLVHPNAILATDVSLSEGAQVMAGACLQYASRIGENTIINTRAIVEHDVCIGSHCHLAPGSIVCGDSVVHDNVFVGAGAVVVQGVTIGAGAVIGAGVTVKSDVAENAIIK